MNSSDIFDLIAQIAADPSKKRKEELLVNYECEHGSAELRRVLTAALDPLTTYGIRALPGRDAPTGENAAFDEHTWSLIDKMASRELTGNLMLQSVQAELNRLGEKSAELLRRILLKDLKAGFGDNTVNKAMPGTIREFPYMRCSLPKGDKLDKLPWAKGVISQEKADAMFMNVNHVTGGLVMLFSRSGTMFPTEAFGRLIDEIRTTFKPDTQTHGEMMVTRDGKILPREEGNGILNHVQSGGSFGANETPLFYVWDQIPLAQIKPKAKINIGYIARLSALGEQLASAKPSRIKLIPTRIVRSRQAAFEHYRELLAQKKEGTIIKTPDAIWKDGTSTEQFKLKLEVTVDLKVTVILKGDPNRKNADRAGRLRCESSDGMLVVDVTIKGEKMRDLVDAHPEEWINRIMPVTANGITSPSDSNPLHSLFLPRFAEASPRRDKHQADSLQQVLDQFEAAILGDAPLAEAA